MDWYSRMLYKRDYKISIFLLVISIIQTLAAGYWAAVEYDTRYAFIFIVSLILTQYVGSVTLTLKQIINQDYDDSDDFDRSSE
jgi:hypothetical protein